MTAIKNFTNAKVAMTLIIEQGEGSTTPDSHDSHYKIFKDLTDKDKLDTYEVPTNPQTKEYEKSIFYPVCKPVLFS
jgi:hypothetical protein